MLIEHEGVIWEIVHHNNRYSLFEHREGYPFPIIFWGYMDVERA